MYCNYFDDYKKEHEINWWDFLFSFLGIYVVIALGLSTIYFIVEVLQDNWDMTFWSVTRFGLLWTFICFIAFFVGVYCWDYFSGKASAYSLFRVKEFKKWYALTPEKFVFDTKSFCLFYVHNDDRVVKDSCRNRFLFKHCDTTTMYPKTLIECVLYCHFRHTIYCDLKRKENSVKKHKAVIQEKKDIIHANNEMLRVLGSIQKDIDTIMVDSNRVIATEIQKMNELNRII